jgi:hypothetical protein
VPRSSQSSDPDRDYRIELDHSRGEEPNHDAKDRAAVCPWSMIARGRADRPRPAACGDDSRKRSATRKAKWGRPHPGRKKTTGSNQPPAQQAEAKEGGAEQG